MNPQLTLAIVRSQQAESARAAQLHRHLADCPRRSLAQRLAGALSFHRPTRAAGVTRPAITG